MTLPQRYGWTPWLVLGASILLTATAALLTAWSARDRDRARFENAVQSTHDRILARLDVYLNTLRGGAALFAVQDSVSLEDFRRYVGRLEVQRRYPGIQGIGWTRRLSSAWPDSAGERHEIRFLEPLDVRNRAAVGFDMSSEPTRRAAMERARDRAEPSLSGRVTLRQEIMGRQQAGFLLYVPVYAGGPAPASVTERRLRLLGFIYSPFRADDLFAGIFGTEAEPRVSFAVYDALRPDSGALLHRSARTRNHEPRYLATDDLEFAGRRWTVQYASEPAFERASASFAVRGAVVAGIIVSAWLFWLALAQSRARRAAETAATAKGRFLASMSHELRTPLNAIGGYVDLLQLEIPGPIVPQQQEYLTRIQRAQQHLLGLINNILNFSKLEAGGVRFELQPVPVHAIVQEAEGYIAPQLASRIITFRILPGPSVAVLADTEKLRQILLNLLSNALKFTGSGGTVTASWRRDGGRVHISVADTGIGIAADKLEQIFDPFVQVDPDLARTRQGTGLGLAISRELARHMDGDITVTSVTGAGSTFFLDLPAHDARGD